MGKQSLTNENPSSKDAAPVKKGTKTKLRIKADDKHAVKKKTPSIHDLFQFQHLLGEGAFGKVYQAVRRRDNVVVALKVVPNPESNSGNQDLEREIQALESLSSPGHPHVCRLLDHHQDNSHCYLAMESIGGGELFEHLCSGGAFSEQDASKFLKQMVDGLHYIHQKGYVHADLKPENLMMGSIQKDQAQVKIVDFGFSVPIETQPLVFGTLAYLPPEFVPQFPKPQTPTYAVDMYAVGVILYTVLTGSHPFDPTNQAPDEVIARHAYQTSVDGNYLDNYVFDERTNGLSSSSMILLRSLLHPDPKQRMTSAKLCAHSWILGKTASGKPLQSHTKLKSFWQKRFRNAILQKFGMPHGTSNTTYRLGTEELRVIFQSIDLNGDGKVTLDELKRALQEFLGVQNMLDILSSVDQDDNGAMDWDEFQTIMQKPFDEDNANGGAHPHIHNTNEKVRVCILEKFGVTASNNLTREMLQTIFDTMDLNHDGTVQLSEAIAVLRETPGIDEEAISIWADKTDSDLNGDIDFEEFCSAMMGKSLDNAALDMSLFT